MATKKTSTNPKKTSKKSEDPEEPVWTYRGYKLKTSEFVTSMVHFFRAEVSRANVWRQRLDTTTNWAVVSDARLDVCVTLPVPSLAQQIALECSEADNRWAAVSERPQAGVDPVNETVLGDLLQQAHDQP